jgi:hypothetical protein
MSETAKKEPENELGPLLGGDDEFKGFKIQEWTLEQFVLISPVLEAMIDGITRRGITWDQIAALFDDNKPEDQEGLTPVGGVKIAFAILPQIPAFLRISLGESEENVKALDLPLSMTLVLRVIGKNFAHFQSFFVDLAREVGTLRAGVETTLSGGASQ